MKTLRIIILLTVISLFTTSPYTTAEARDCSNPKGFHEKLMCKKFKLNMPTFKKKSQDSESTSTTENTEENKKKGIGGIWYKIKNLGGKKVGEPG
tara:strand:+ start:69 stop:353 length:285 start_codon:yes stop_codon:yes gene_type:complete